MYFLSSLSGHVHVLSFPSFLNFLRTKVADHVRHFRTGRTGVILFITPDGSMMVINFDEPHPHRPFIELRPVSVFELVPS